MCLIISRPAGIPIAPSLIKSAAQQNRDGWGVTGMLDGRLTVYRGLDYDTLPDAIGAYGDSELIVHFRLATHGAKDVSNCHPFLTDDGLYSVTHNGIIDIPEITPDRSDTYQFTRYVLGPLLSTHSALWGSEELPELIATLAGPSNKLAIMRHDGETTIVNRAAWSTHEGLLLSNLYSVRTQSYFPLRKANTHIATWADEVDPRWGLESDERFRRLTHYGERVERDYQVVPACKASCAPARKARCAPAPDTLSDLSMLSIGEIVKLCNQRPWEVAQTIKDYDGDPCEWCCRSSQRTD